MLGQALEWRLWVGKTSTSAPTSRTLARAQSKSSIMLSNSQHPSDTRQIILQPLQQLNHRPPDTTDKAYNESRSFTGTYTDTDTLTCTPTIPVLRRPPVSCPPVPCLVSANPQQHTARVRVHPPHPNWAVEFRLLSPPMSGTYHLYETALASASTAM